MAAKYAKLLLGCYRTGEANDPEVYTSSIVLIMSKYPEDVLQSIVNPLTGIPSKIDWLPKPKEVLAACEEIEGPRRRAREWEQRAQEQLAERAALEGQPRKIPQHMLDELAAHGMVITGGKPSRRNDAPEVFAAKYGLTKEQFDAIPENGISEDRAAELELRGRRII